MTASTTSNGSTVVAERRGLSGPALLATAFLLTTGVGLAFQTADFAFGFSEGDPYRAEGPVDSLKNMALFGGIALILALAITLPLRRDPGKARVGAIILGSLALLTLPFFWSGAPAILGAAAAWLAGLTKNTQPQTGAARGFGIVGLVVAAILVVATPVLYLTSLLTSTS